MKIAKRTLLFSLCATMLFTSVACDESKGDTQITTGNISVWSKASTVTVMRDKEYAEDFKEEAVYEIIAGRGEYEASQLFITTPVGTTVEYTIEVSDLICGENVIDKSYIDIYNEKYIEVVSSKAAYSTGLGWYPDALLPFEKAIEYGENVAGDDESLRNQGIYIETFIPRSIPAGDYKGMFKLRVGEMVYEIPACVTVCDFEVSQESHLAQYWITNHRGFGDLDTTAAMKRKYFEAQARYRASAHSMQAGAQTLDEWMEIVRTYTNPNLRDEEGKPLLGEKETYLAAINIPTTYNATDGIDRAQFDEYLSRLTYWSIKDGYDYLAKVGNYPGYIDEPQFNNTWDKVKIACDGYNEYKNYWASEIIAKEDYATINAKGEVSEEKALTQADFDNLTDDFKTRLAKSMSLIGYYVTIHPDDRLDNNSTTQFYAGVSSAIDARDIYEIENWTDVETSGNRAYVCGSAEFGYNIDTEPVSQRLMGWYMCDKGLTGFLLWETAYYSSNTWSTTYPAGTKTPCDSYACAEKCTSGVGDGYLFYPGKAYEIDGPIGSIRAHQYREASEDYEYFYLLKNLYAEKGYSLDKIVERMCTLLYSEQAVTDNTEIFIKQRKEIINLLLLAKKGVFITEYKEVNAKMEIKLVSTDAEAITAVNGEAISATKETTVVFDATQKDGNLTFKTSSGLSFTFYSGGKATLLQGAETNAMTVVGGTVTADTFDGRTTARLDFSVDESINEEKRAYHFSLDVGKEDISRSTKMLLASFYNEGEKPVVVELWFLGKDGRNAYVDDLVIEPHSYGTMISTRLDCENWSAIRSLEGVRYKIESLEGEENYTVHFFGLCTVG